MKANEVPEKIYFCTDENGTHYYTEGIPFEREYIEYTRTDAFIKKACDYLCNHIDKDLTIYHKQTWCKLDEFIEKFCKYMKRE